MPTSSWILTKTAVFDTMSMTHTLDVVRQLAKPFAVVLTFVPPQGQENRRCHQGRGGAGGECLSRDDRQSQGVLPGAGRGSGQCRSLSHTARQRMRFAAYTTIRLYTYTKRRRLRDGEGERATGDVDRAKVATEPATLAPAPKAEPVAEKPASSGAARDQADRRALSRRRSAPSYASSRPRRGRP